MPSAMNFNARVLDKHPEFLEQTQRALFYGDALFETIRVFDGKTPLLTRHWGRLSAGLRSLGFEIPSGWSTSYFEKEILRISPKNARVRLTVWRSPGGKYAPVDNTPQFLITAEAMSEAQLMWPKNGLELGLCQSVLLPVDAFSNLKTLNAPRYVAASREAQANHWDDALLLNAHGRVCEATSSNVFWWEGDLLCTVPLSEGCVAGVFRAFVLETASGLGIQIVEKAATPETLLAAAEIFLTNAVRGIVPVRIFAGQSRPSTQTSRLFSQLEHALFNQQSTANSQPR